MTTNDSPVLGRNHLPLLAVVPIWEGPIVYPRASVILHSRNHGVSKGSVRKGGCCPELPI